MPTTIVQPATIMLDTATLLINGDDYAASVSSVQLTPNGGSPAVWKGLKKNKIVRSTLADWSLDLDFAQDTKTAKALLLYCFQNEGTVAPYSLQLADGGTWTGNVLLVPAQIGGARDAVLNSTVSLSCVEKPTFTAAT